MTGVSHYFFIEGIVLFFLGLDLHGENSKCGLKCLDSVTAALANNFLRESIVFEEPFSRPLINKRCGC